MNAMSTRQATTSMSPGPKEVGNASGKNGKDGANMTLIGIVKSGHPQSDRVTDSSTPVINKLTTETFVPSSLVMSKNNDSDKKQIKKIESETSNKKSAKSTSASKGPHEQSSSNDELASLKARLEEALDEKAAVQKKLSELTKRVEEEALIIQVGNGNLSKKVADLHCSLGAESLENVVLSQEMLFEESHGNISLVHKDWPTITHLQPLLNEIMKTANELKALDKRMNEFRGDVRLLHKTDQPKESLKSDFDPYIKNYEKLYNDAVQLKADEKIAELGKIIYALKHYAEPFKIFNQLTKNEAKYEESLSKDLIKCETLLKKMKDTFNDLVHMYEDSIWYMNKILEILYPSAYTYIKLPWSQISEEDKIAPKQFKSPYEIGFTSHSIKYPV